MGRGEQSLPAPNIQIQRREINTTPSSEHFAYSNKIQRLLQRAKEATDLFPSTEPKAARIPSSATSVFIINKAQGDNAEEVVKEMLNSSDMNAVHYGRGEDLIAGDPGFKEFYTEYLSELKEIGKRPDLLVGDVGSEKITQADDPAVKRARAGLEVRSSAYNLAAYQDHHQDKEGSLSFTVKVEDVLSVARWCEKFGVPHYYVQVFKDQIHAIPFEAVLRVLAEGEAKKDYSIKKDQGNQFKNTIHIPLKEGKKIADVVEEPNKVVASKQLPNGRVMDYVGYTGGRARLDGDAFARMLEEE